MIVSTFDYLVLLSRRNYSTPLVRFLAWGAMPRQSISASMKCDRNGAFVAIIGFFALSVLYAAAADPPPAEAFRVLPPTSAGAPVITPYLKYQTEVAWQEEDLRR